MLFTFTQNIIKISLIFAALILYISPAFPPNTSSIPSEHTKILLRSVLSFYKAESNISNSSNLSLPTDLDSSSRSIQYKIVKTYPHVPDSFTQGLAYEDGYLYEGVGQYGSSELRRVRLETGEILQSFKLPGQVFGEGITIFEDKVFQLTWKARTGFIIDKARFALLKIFRYPVPIEGWGLTNDGENLIISDGTSTLYFINPESYTVSKLLKVYDHTGQIKKINELEYIEGAIFANIWQTDKIIRVDKSSGKVTGIIDLKKIVPNKYKDHQDYVLNGIAYDSKNKRIFVTGKMWPLIYEIELEL